ncbi:hypothetical protein BDC45DRAFT_542741 [Circinella umbellata]|nr:hypothetical protein BDC45DRAFT_542741 [Circinella umbellata]
MNNELERKLLNHLAFKNDKCLLGFHRKVWKSLFYYLSTLPQEILLEILSHIESWETRVEFLCTNHRFSRIYWPMEWNLVFSMRDINWYWLDALGNCFFMQCATHITINHDKESIVSITKLTCFVQKLKALRSLYINEGVVLKDNISHFLRTITRTAIVYLQVSAVEHDIFQNESHIFSNYDISIFCIKSNDNGFNIDSMNNDKDTISSFDISDSNHLELTPKGSHSLDQVLKRNMVDMYDTPERIYNAIKHMKLLHKAEDINQDIKWGAARVGNYEINTLGMQYRQMKRVKEVDILPATPHNNDDRVDEVVLAQAAQLIEAVVVWQDVLICAYTI